MTGFTVIVVVSNLSIEHFSFVKTPGIPLIGFVDSSERWIIANFKETEIESISSAMKAHLNYVDLASKGSLLNPNTQQVDYYDYFLNFFYSFIFFKDMSWSDKNYRFSLVKLRTFKTAIFYYSLFIFYYLLELTLKHRTKDKG